MNRLSLRPKSQLMGLQPHLSIFLNTLWHLPRALWQTANLVLSTK